jgi:hypothetical protein
VFQVVFADSPNASSYKFNFWSSAAPDSAAGALRNHSHCYGAQSGDETGIEKWPSSGLLQDDETLVEVIMRQAQGSEVSG